MGKEFNRQSLSILMASIIGPGLGGIATLAFPVFLTAMAQQYGGRGIVSALYTVAGLAGYAGMLIVGAAVDRWGARHVAPAVALFSAIVTCLLWPTASLGLGGLFLLFLLAGFGNSTLAAYSKLNAVYFNRRRGFAFALSAMGLGVIWFMAIPQTASALLASFDWRQSYGIMGLAALIGGVPLIAWLVRDAGVAGPSATGASGVEPREAWRTPIFWMIIVGVCAEAATVNSCRAHMVALMTDRGVSAHMAALVLSSALAGTLIGQPLAGWLLDRCASARIVLPFVFCSVGGVLLLAFGTSLPMWIAGNVVMSAGYAAELLMAPYFFTRFFGARNHGRIYGSMFVCLAPITAAAPAVMGFIYDRTGSYQPALIGFAIALAIGGACLFLLPPFRFPARES